MSLDGADRDHQSLSNLLIGSIGGYQEVLTCRFLLHLSARQTALSMGVTETNVKVMQYRALRRAANLEALRTREVH
jgi:RNA polymerase sigma-70 factor, ECF subfamily